MYRNRRTALSVEIQSGRYWTTQEVPLTRTEMATSEGHS